VDIYQKGVNGLIHYLYISIFIHPEQLAHIPVGGFGIHSTGPIKTIMGYMGRVSERLLFNANSAICQLCHHGSKLIFNEMMMMMMMMMRSALF
jgi:hypothetical protein